jgi:long-chain acyl-CoA synthetase
VVAVLMENNARYLEVAWAAIRSGLYLNVLNHHLGTPEVSYIVTDSSARVLIASAGQRQIAEALSFPTSVRRLAVGGQIDGFEPCEALVAAQPASARPDEQEGEILQYSSGTTGRPKGIRRELSGRPISLEKDGTVPFLRRLGFAERDVYLSPAPLYHTAPIHWSMAVHRLGGTVVVMEQFDAEEALALIERYRVTHVQMVPTMFVRMLRLPAEVRTRYDLSSLRAVVHSAAPCPAPVKRQMIDWLGPIVSEFYGSSEGVGGTFITASEWLAHPGSVGRAMAGAVHIVDENGNEVPAGVPGEIWTDVARPFRYLNDEAKTAAARDRRGWMTVGDIGYLDDEGYLYLTDRKAHMIISGGVNIYPQEAENVLVSHPLVLDAAVIGVPNNEYGQEVKAIVQPVDWADAGPLLEQELIGYCRASLARYKCPRSIDFEQELPRLPNGKLYKRALRQRYEAP